MWHAIPFEFSARCTRKGCGEGILGLGFNWSDNSYIDDPTYFASVYLIWWRLRVTWRRKEDHGR